jgi:3-deoxy-manno-octulosonate cytidylyltransferase (CMP-KDO synthetase)
MRRAGAVLLASADPVPARPAGARRRPVSQHIGIYAYSRDALTRWVAAPPSAAELAERLEQLRALHLGLSIGVAALAEAALPGIDTGDDLRRAEAHWHAFQG